jgi:uncharacterized membrane protein
LELKPSNHRIYTMPTTPLTPAIAIHLCAALAAIAVGPVALWARRSSAAAQRPRLHRAAGYSWTTLMLITALSALWIVDTRPGASGGYSPIHLLVPYTLGSMGYAFWTLLVRRNVAAHRATMVRLYTGSCVIAGLFTLLPNRYLGQILWAQWLGVL